MYKINVVWAENLNPENLADLREQVELSIADPSHVMISNFEVHWTEIKLNQDEVPRIIWADSISAVEIEELREQVDKALVDPNFPIVTPFEIHVEGIDTIEKVEKEVKSGLRLTRYQILKNED